MRRATIAGMGLLVLALSLPMCTGVPLTAPSNTTITLIANPTFVPAHGGVSVVTAILVERAGTPVPNGTNVFFFTNLGRVDASAKTKDGIARVNFVSDSRSGLATVTAVSGGAAAPIPTASPTPTTSAPLSLGMGVAYAQESNTGMVDIRVGSALPDFVLVVADPARITSPRHSFITANVFDLDGNPVANVPVIFTVTATGTGVALEETLDSGGRPQFTDTNGQAFDVLRTRSAFGGPQKVVTVTATTPTGVADDVPVAIN